METAEFGAYFLPPPWQWHVAECTSLPGTRGLEPLFTELGPSNDEFLVSRGALGLKLGNNFPPRESSL